MLNLDIAVYARGNQRLLNEPLSDGIQALDNKLEQLAQQSKKRSVDSVVIVLGMDITYDVLDGSGEMDSLNPST
jgi:cell division protein ZapA (FtsZ GTPase activity inhibitor)